MDRFIARPVYLEKLKAFMDKDPVKIVTGVRRCGKSTLLALFRRFLRETGVSDKQIIDINLEDAAFRALHDWRNLHDYVVSRLAGNMPNYVFIDEIQIVADFEKAVNSLNLRGNVDLYVTGSNAQMLSGEIATLISGRYIEIQMLPLSFREFLSAQPDTANPSEKFADYLALGGFPGVLQFCENRMWADDYIRSVYNTVLLKDIIARKRIADVSRLESVANFMFDIIGSETSINNIYKNLKADGREVQIPTIEGYLQAMRDSFILYKAGRFDIKGRKLLKTNDKYYLVDMGFRHAALGRQDTDYGHILENIVYLELLRRGYETYIGKIGDKEVDFIARKNDTVEYYQVAQSALDPATLTRELSPLERIGDHYQKFLLTMDYLDFSRNGIKHLNIVEWLL